MLAASVFLREEQIDCPDWVVGALTELNEEHLTCNEFIFSFQVFIPLIDALFYVDGHFNVTRVRSTHHAF